MTAYIERGELLERLSGRRDAASRALRDALSEDASAELVPVTPIDAVAMLPTYQVRLERSLAREGPRTLGLAEWVRALEVGASKQLAVVRVGSTTGLCLLDADGRVEAVTTTEGPT